MFHSLPQNTQPNAKFSFNVTFSLQQLSELLKLPNDEEDNDDKNKKANDDRKKTRLTYIATVWIQVFFFFFQGKRRLFYVIKDFCRNSQSNIQRLSVEGW